MAEQVFSKKHRDGIDGALITMFQRVVSHIPVPDYNVDDFFDHMIKPEHLEPLSQVTEIVGPIQSHTTAQFYLSDRPTELVMFRFPTSKRLLPKYIENMIIDVRRTPEFWAPLLSWRDQRLEWGTRFSRAAWLVNYLDSNAETLPAFKLYFNGITPLMAMVDGLEKRTDATRETRIPSRLPTLHPEARGLKKEADATISTAVLYEEIADEAVRRFELLTKPSFAAPISGKERSVW